MENNKESQNGDLKYWKAFYGYNFLGTHYSFKMVFQDGTEKDEYLPIDTNGDLALEIMKAKIAIIYPGRENDVSEMEYDGSL